MTEPRSWLASDPSASVASRRAAGALIAIGVAHAALAATHGGEFWPFSIYPMFSQAGRSWARALVIEAGPSPLRPALAAHYALDELPGAPLGLDAYGIPQNDVSSLVQRADRWGKAELEALRSVFGSLPCEHPLLVLVVRGTLAESAVQYAAAPVAWLWCDGGRVNVELAERLRLTPPEEATR